MERRKAAVILGEAKDHLATLDPLKMILRCAQDDSLHRLHDHPGPDRAQGHPEREAGRAGEGSHEVTALKLCNVFGLSLILSRPD